MDREFEEESILMACALRFDGYAYHELRNRGDGRWDFMLVTDRLVATREFPSDDLECFAAYFALQRYLGKWGGEYCTPHSDEHIVYRLLFLHLYRTEIPVAFRMRGYYESWEEEYKPRREELAARIRRTFRRKGRGPKLYKP